ncbi:MAG: hypothetical protein PVI26_00365 [Chitinispirillia bacterium]
MLVSFIIISLDCSKIRNQRSLTDINRNKDRFFFIDTLNSFQASGDLKLSVDGERFRGKVDIIIKERTNFESTVYTPFSMVIASFRSIKDSVFMEIGESKYTGCLTDTINSLSFFPSIPFNFSDLIRILTGRIIKVDCLLKEIQLSRRNIIRSQCDSLTFKLILTKNKLKVKSVNISFSHGKSLWSADFSKFRNGFSEDIEIISNKSDYLELRLNITKYD